LSEHATQAISPHIPLADINDDPYFRRLLALAYKNGATGNELAACVNTWHQRQLERYRRSPPAVGLSNDRLLDLAVLASLTGDPAKLIDYGRSVLSAATHPSPLLGAAKRAILAEGPKT
jgi:hypothetical protein